jgi:hypothetical protein
VVGYLEKKTGSFAFGLWIITATAVISALIIAMLPIRQMMATSQANRDDGSTDIET